MRVVAIIQARMGSSRLPGKILMDLAGEPMLARVVGRLRRARTLAEVVVATTVEPADEAVERLCAARGWACFRGSQDDVLDRYYRAAQQAGAEVIVRITADCPLIEPAVVDRVVQEFLDRRDELDHACNVWPRRTFPRGLDTEVFPWRTLDRLWHEDRDPATREHVTAYVYKHPELFRLHNVVNDTDLSGHRWTVDTPEDLALVRNLYGELGGDAFTWHDVLALLERRPEWRELNRGVVQKVV